MLADYSPLFFAELFIWSGWFESFTLIFLHVKTKQTMKKSSKFPKWSTDLKQRAHSVRTHAGPWAVSSDGGRRLGLHPAHLNNLNCLNWWSWKLQHDTFWPVLGSNWVLSKESFVCNSVNGHYTWHASMITYDRLIGFSLDAAEPSAPLICWNLHIYV